jgi:hypothetical protein
LLLVDAVVLECFELVESAVVGAVRGGAIAMEEGEALFDVGVLAEDRIASGFFVESGVGNGKIAETPCGVNELVEDVEFDRAFGFEVGGVVRDECVVVFLLFWGIEDDAGGGEAVDAAVLGRAGFALGGDGAMGLGSVDASGVAMSLADSGHRVVLWLGCITRRFWDLWGGFVSGCGGREKYSWIDGDRNFSQSFEVSP